MSTPTLSCLAKELLVELVTGWRPRIGCNGNGEPDPWELEDLAEKFQVTPSDVLVAISELRATRYLVPDIIEFAGIPPTGWLELQL